MKMEDASLILKKAMPYLLVPKISASDSKARNLKKKKSKQQKRNISIK